MEIITAHNALDFDGLASMVGASKLYPSAFMVIPGTVSKKIKQFMGLYKDSLFIKTPKEINLKDVTRVILVDTANPGRLGQLKELAQNKTLDYHIYDHHPQAADDLVGSIHEVHKTGALTTVMVEKIVARDIAVSPFEATILALGIYEDTGSLLFPSTTARDAQAVSHLLNYKANLKVVANFMEQPFSVAQRQILQSLLDTARHYKINNVDILMALCDSNEFIPGLDMVAYRLFSMEEADAVFVIALMQGKVNVVARSGTNNLRVNEVLHFLGGRGHEKAAAAVVKGKSCAEVAELILSHIPDKIRPAVVARDIMSTPVKTIAQYRTMEEAGRIMLRYGHTGMPVVDGEKVVGVISRRDADKAIVHELGHAPVKGFMTTEVITVSPDTSINEIQKMVVEYDIGRLPVVDQGRLVGIVSRTDILRILHGEDTPEDHELLYSFSDGGAENLRQLMRERLPEDIFAVLQQAGAIAQELDSTVYCVGGYVRDLLLNVPNFDMDLVAEGDGRELATRLAQRLGGKVRIHDRFATASVILNEGTKIDVATARTEYYEFPAALPMVERSSIREDMYRRDFTINTLALCLNPNKFGDLIDYFGGRKDIQNRYIRILYNLSFVEDPTRILRAIRFEQRYRFTIEPDTLRFAKDAIDRRMLGKLSYKRIMQELILILSEKDPMSALERMTDTGVWKYILPEVKLEKLTKVPFKRIPIVIGWWENRYYGPKIQAWLVYLQAIFSKLTEPQLADVLSRYPLDRSAQRSIEDSACVPLLAQRISNDPNLRPSQLYKMLSHLGPENMLYLLLHIRQENVWDRVVQYCDLKEKVKVEINGHDLKKMGLKAGPDFKSILAELYLLKLDGVINNRKDELDAVRQWMAEGRFANAVAH
ncbi:MAG: CBS domain-containing protein [Syntrophomonadaceae bacterium]|nr:CBS domain-containing protein [Syntrophomonadaceae bacterium]